MVPSGGRAPASLEGEHARAGRASHGDRRLRGGTVDDGDELGSCRELCPQGEQARLELALVVVNGNDDRAAHGRGRQRVHPSRYYGRRRPRDDNSSGRWVPGRWNREGSCDAVTLRVASSAAMSRSAAGSRLLLLGQRLNDDSFARWLESNGVDGLDSHLDIRSQEG